MLGPTGEVCGKCESHERTYWGPVPLKGLYPVSRGNFVNLIRCTRCRTLWVESPYEPGLSFEYRVKWPWTKDTFEAVHEPDDGKTLRSWLHLRIREDYEREPRDVERIEWHRQRTYGHYNPIDLPEERSLGDVTREIVEVHRAAGSG